MSGPIGDEGDLLGIGLAVGTRSAGVEQRTDLAHELEVVPLAACAEQISFPRPATAHGGHKAVHVIFDEEPIPYVRAGSIDRDWRTRERMPEHRRDQFFRVLPGSVIVRAIGDDDGNTVRAVPRPGEMVGGSLAGGIWGIRGVPAACVERPTVGERAEYLVGGDLNKPEALATRAAQPRPMAKRRFKKDKGPANVGRDERFGRVDRAVDMAFSREMQHRIRVEVTEGLLHRPAIRDVGL
jgi:hypothetical protein